MRRILLTIAIFTLLATALPHQAQAIGLRVGGMSVVEPGSDHKFAIGIDNDTRLARFLAINTGTLFSIDGDSMHTDGYLGLKVFIPVALQGKLELTLRGNFLLKWFYLFDDSAFFDRNAIAIGGIVGPGVRLNLGKIALSFELDVQIYDFMWPSVYKKTDTNVALAYLFGIGF